MKCKQDGCEVLVRIRSDQPKHSGFCISHSHIKRPFESIYNRLFNDWRKIKVTLTYEEFLEFTKVKNCHYCKTLILWRPYSREKGKHISSAYFLDRKSPQKPYSKENCVVCCTECNFIKGSRFNYEEFLIVGIAIQTVRQIREWKSAGGRRGD